MIESYILTNCGLKKASDVRLTDMVFDGDSYVRIRKIFYETDNLIYANSRGRNIVGSPEQLVMVVDGNKIVGKRFKNVNNRDWAYIPRTKLFDIDLVNVGKKPRIRGLRFWKERFSLTPDIVRVMGLYAGDGCSYPYDYTTLWTFGPHEQQLADEVVEVLNKNGIGSYKHFVESMGTFGLSKTWKVRVRNKWLYELFEKLNLGHTAFNKNSCLFKSNMAKSFISGWLDADGSYYKKTGTISGFSRSTDLIKKIDCMLLSLGICSFIKKNGQEVNVSMRNDVNVMSGWMKTDRFKFDNHYVRKRSYASPNMRKFKDGWITKIRSCGYVKESSKIVRLETDTGKYTSNFYIVT